MLVLCDIDGVVVDPRENVRRYLSGLPKDWAGYYAHVTEMAMIPETVKFIHRLLSAEDLVIFHTGRNEFNRNATVSQLVQIFPELMCMFGWLRMRPNGDHRAAAVLKLDNCKQLNPDLVIDDEPETAELLRKNGFTVLQVHGYRGEEQQDFIPE